ncbi:jun-like transcription factor [Coemansia sp. BCRC 34301]|nr:jun-like transcription factor [Coemansia sp. BCRC 34301]
MAMAGSKKAGDLAKVQALLAECGLERTAAALLAEAAKISKKNATVRAFLETATVNPKAEKSPPVPQTAPTKAAVGYGGKFAKRGEVGNAPNTPFCRIRPEDVVYADERLKDNTYISKGGVDNDFGYKAHMDLIVTRGKGFTKEKNKKKRGSYSGGKITMQSHSIKFE